jgi:hypothetical protein
METKSNVMNREKLSAYTELDSFYSEHGTDIYNHLFEGTCVELETQH